MKEIVTSQDLCQAGQDRLLIHLALKCNIPAQRKATWATALMGLPLGIACVVVGILQDVPALTDSGVFIGILIPCIVMTRLRFLRFYQIIRCLVAELEKEEAANNANARE